MGGFPDESRVLLVDDDERFRDRTATVLEGKDEGFRVEPAASAGEALDYLDREPLDCVVTDYDVSGTEGLAFLDAVRQVDEDLPVILFTATESEEIITAAIERDVSQYLRKGEGEDQFRLLADRIETAVERYRTEQRTARFDALRSLVSDLVRKLFRSSTPRTVEREVCSNLVDAEFYRAAWIGRYDAESRTVSPQAAAGTDVDALDTIDVRTEDAQSGDRPIVQAVRTHEIAVDRDDGGESAAETNPRGLADSPSRFVVPIVQDEKVYGVLVLAGEGAPPFDDRERKLLETLGEDIGQAIRSRRTHRRLHEKHERRTALLENTRRPVIDGHISDDGEYVVRDVNDAFERVFGFDAADVIGRDVGDVVVPEQLRPEHEALRDRVRSGESVEAEVERLTAHGRRDFLLDLVPYGTETGSIDGWYAWYTDVTEHQEQERELRQIIEQMNDAVFVHRPNGNFLAVNQTAVDRYGYTESEILDMGPTDLDAEEEVSEIDDRREHILDEGNAVFETTHRASDGERIPVEINSNRIRFRDGQAILSIARDVSQRKKQTRQRRRFQRAAEASGHAIYITDADGTIEYVNPAFEAITGYASPEAVGREPSILKSGEMSEEYYQQLWDTLLAGEVWEEELVNRRKDGDLYHAHQTIAPLTDEAGDVEAFVAVQADVTERKRREQRLEDLADRLQEIKRRHDLALDATETGIWLWDFERGEITAYGKTDDLFGVDPDERDPGAYVERIHDEDYPEVQDAVERATESGEVLTAEFRIQTDGPERWVHARGTVLEDEFGTSERMLGVITDISVRKRREAKLERRERKVRQLHATTRDLLTLSEASEVFDRIADAMADVLNVERFKLFQFDDEAGTLETFAVSPPSGDATGRTVSIGPGDDPIWDVFRDGETKVFDELQRPDLFVDLDESTTNLLAVPIGDFGVLLTTLPSEDATAPGDVGLVELLATNAQGVLRRIHHERELGEVSRLLSNQDTRIDELEGLIDTVQSTQRRIAESETREALETAACEALVATDRVDFAWIGRPGTVDTELSPTVWAGDERGFLDTVTFDDPDVSLPSQRAATQRRNVCVSNVSRRVYDERWAKEALSREFRSVLSLPLLHDGVLYGVLTAYSREESAFDEMHESVFEDVGSILVNYLTILNIRRSDTHESFVKLEFEVTDPSHPLQTLASETGCTIRFDTVAETTTNDVRLLVTVLDGDPTTVLDSANAIVNVENAEQFGDAEHEQLKITIGKPFLASTVTNHGGTLTELIADGESTRFLTEIPTNVAERPLIEALRTRFDDIEIVSRRETDGTSAATVTDPESVLTDRQFEILRAAYYGGYYETPRGVTGEELADSFGISNSVVYDHLQAAHRTLLGLLLESAGNTERRNI